MVIVQYSKMLLVAALVSSVYTATQTLSTTEGWAMDGAAYTLSCTVPVYTATPTIEWSSEGTKYTKAGATSGFPVTESDESATSSWSSTLTIDALSFSGTFRRPVQGFES